MAVAWYTQVEKKPTVRVARSTDSGQSFGTPIDVVTGDVLGRVAGALFKDGSLAVCWFGRQDKRAVLRLQRFRSDGSADKVLTLASVGASRSSGFPSMAGDGQRAVVSWTDLSDGPQVRTVLVTLGR